jgi:L-lactate utilization protein LutB
MEFIKKAYKVKGEAIIKNLQKRGMEGWYFDSREEAVEKIMSMIKQDDIVSWGGSYTIDELGIKKLLEERRISVIDRDKAKSPEENVKLRKQSLTADVYLTSTNAITIDGELINVDGAGNRLAAYCYGPDSVIVVAGMNKTVPELSAALGRIRSDAAIPNAFRVNAQTPCRFTGKCSECTSKDTLCSQILVTRYSKPQNRIKVILIGENLGF